MGLKTAAVVTAKIETMSSAVYTELLYDDVRGDVSELRGLRFCLLGPDEIRRMSVAEITRSETFSGIEPVPNGLFDPRMGIIDHGRVCPTCQQRNTFCPGHFGHIELAKPVFSVAFLDYVRKLLTMVCHRCARPLIKRDEADAFRSRARSLSNRQKRWEHAVKACTDKVCSHCGTRRVTRAARDGISRLALEFKPLSATATAAATIAGQELEPDRVYFAAEDVRQILAAISDADADLLGFSAQFGRPEWMICSVLPVPPPAVRPSVRNDIGQRSEDDLVRAACPGHRHVVLQHVLNPVL